MAGGHTGDRRNRVGIEGREAGIDVDRVIAKREHGAGVGGGVAGESPETGGELHCGTPVEEVLA